MHLDLGLLWFFAVCLNLFIDCLVGLWFCFVVYFGLLF